MAIFNGFNRNVLDPNYVVGRDGTATIEIDTNSIMKNSNSLKMSNVLSTKDTSIFRTDINLVPPIDMTFYLKKGISSGEGGAMVFFGGISNAECFYVWIDNWSVDPVVGVGRMGGANPVRGEELSITDRDNVIAQYESGVVQIDLNWDIGNTVTVDFRNKSTQALIATLTDSTMSLYSNGGLGFMMWHYVGDDYVVYFDADIQPRESDFFVSLSNSFGSPNEVVQKSFVYEDNLYAVTRNIITNMYYVYKSIDEGINFTIADSVFYENLYKWVMDGSVIKGVDEVFEGFGAFSTIDNPNAYFSTTSGITTADFFGESIDTCESYTIVGANLEDDEGANDSGKAYIFENATGNLVSVLTNPNGYDIAANDEFGTKVAISESYAIVGVRKEEDAGGTSAGKAYIFDVKSGTLLWTLDNPNSYGTSGADFFGSDVSICESYAIVGAEGEDGVGGTSSGAAYIFDPRNGQLLWTLDNPNDYGTIGGDTFGISVSISESYAIVGAQYEDDATNTSSGKAYIFNPATGVKLWTLDNPNGYGTSENDFFGKTVAITESYAIIGSAEDSSGATDSGKAYIFNPATGTILWTLDNPNGYNVGFSDFFGSSVAICESYAIVGAHLEDDAGGLSAGKAYIFNPATGVKLWTLDNPNGHGTSDGDQFGYSVGISESYATASANQESDESGTLTGKVYIFDPSNGVLATTLDNVYGPGGATNDNFGTAVAICDKYMIVTAKLEDDASGTSGGKAYIYSADTNELLWTLDNPNGYDVSAGDNFGISVAISESYSIIGAENEDDAGGTSSGKAYIFDNSTGVLLWTLDNPNDFGTSSTDLFGHSVGISESYAIVGAFFEDDTTDDFSGRAYIFDTSDGQLLWTLDNPNAYGTVSGDQFGWSVAICESYAIVGAENEDDAGGNGSGKAYIFDPSTGVKLWTLDNPNGYNTSLGDKFGYSVAICESYAIVGAYLEDDIDGASAGKAYIFNPATGVKLWTLDNPNGHGASAGDQFGYSVGISESYAIIGANYEGDDGGTLSGKAYIFDPSNGNLIWNLNNPNGYGTSASDIFGYSVAISDNYAIAGAYTEDDFSGLGSGKAYRFFLTQASITIDNPNGYGTSLDDQFGSSVAISESYAIIGAFREDDDGGTSAGKAYIYNNVTGALLWTLDNPNAYGTSGANRFGLSVAISESYAIAGAHLEDDDAGGNSGKAYIFNPNTGSLLWTLDNPNGYSTSLDDYFGYDVDISESYAIVGAYKEDDASGTESGKAYIFDPSTGELLWTLDNPNAYGTSADDNFGYSVSISESYAIVGAYAEDGDGVVISGKAYIFNSSTGVLLWTLDNPNAYDLATGDYFGRSVSISESYAIVGADEENDVGGIESGKAYIFDPSTGDLLWTLDNPNAYSVSAIDTFGFDVWNSESYAIVGALFESDAGGVQSGKAYVFSPSTGALLWILDNPNAYDTSAGDNFGCAVAISESCAIVGAYFEDDAGGTESGKAYLINPLDLGVYYERQFDLSTDTFGDSIPGNTYLWQNVVFGDDDFGLIIEETNAIYKYKGIQTQEITSIGMKPELAFTDGTKAYFIESVNGLIKVYSFLHNATSITLEDSLQVNNTSIYNNAIKFNSTKDKVYFLINNNIVTYNITTSTISVDDVDEKYTQILVYHTTDEIILYNENTGTLSVYDPTTMNQTRSVKRDIDGQMASNIFDFDIDFLDPVMLSNYGNLIASGSYSQVALIVNISGLISELTTDALDALITAILGAPVLVAIQIDDDIKLTW